MSGIYEILPESYHTSADFATEHLGVAFFRRCDTIGPTDKRKAVIAMNSAEKLRLLRQRMQEQGMDAYVVVTDDFHGSEYVGDYFKAREYLSGFTGSAGTLAQTLPVSIRAKAARWPVSTPAACSSK